MGRLAVSSATQQFRASEDIATSTDLTNMQKETMQTRGKFSAWYWRGWVHITLVGAVSLYSLRVFAAESPVRVDQILIPIETALLVTESETKRLCVVMIYPDAVPYDSIAYISVWQFPTSESFYSLRKQERLPGLSPMGNFKDVTHELHTAKLGDTITILGSQFSWLPNTRRSSWLKTMSDGRGLQFGIWRVSMSPPDPDSMSTFEKLTERFNEESLELGSVPVN